MTQPRNENGLPKRPPDGAPLADWKAYAAALEAIAAAGERRANFVHERLNALISSPAYRLARSAKNLIGKRAGKMPPETARTPRVDGEPLVSVLIPFRDGAKYLSKCLDSFAATTQYKNVEFMLIDNGSEQAATRRLLDRLKERPRTQILRVDEPFNYSWLNNLAAERVSGEFLLLLNNDIEIIHAHWLEVMLEQAQKPGVGAVGARLLYPDGRIQHAGVSVRLDDIAGHEHHLKSGADAAAAETREVDAVTGACLLTPRALYRNLGGLNETHLPVAYNDVDYCLRVRERELKVVLAAQACLIHHESVTRGAINAPEQAAYMVRRWGAELSRQ